MIHIKKEHEVKIMQEGGERLRRVLNALIQDVKVGTTGKQLDILAEKLIKEEGGTPSFKKVAGYHWSTCICTNDIVVHGIPTNDPFAAGDIAGIDVGMFYKGFHTDASWSVVVGHKKDFPQQYEFLRIGEEILNRAIKKVKVGSRIGEISAVIQKGIEDKGFSVMRELVGHGVGRSLHEDPEIPGVVRGKIEKTPVIKEGMALAVEVIYSLGDPDIFLDEDGWTIRTKDGTISGLFEKTVIAQDHGVLVLT